AFLFRPGEAVLAPAGTDNGTPTQPDEPRADNPPAGALIDYYLKSAATGPITLEIFDSGSQLVRRFSSDEPRAAVDVPTLAVNAAWQRPPEPLSASAGAHRFVWDLRHQPPAGGRGG